MRGRTLSIVVPVFNEERRLPALLDRLNTEADAVLAPADLELLEVIVVDDGSADGTSDILAMCAHLPGRLRSIRLAAHHGKGAAVKAGARAAKGDRILMTDVDLSTPLEEVVGLSAELDRGVDFAMGSRSLPASDVVVHQPAHRELAGKTFNLLFRLATGLAWRDTQCGFKLFRRSTTRELFELQRVEGFAYDAELCVNADRLGLRVSEVPVRWMNNVDTRVTLFGSSVQMALDLARIAWRARRLKRPSLDETLQREAVGETSAGMKHTVDLNARVPVDDRPELPQP
ncbi:MAG TPA: glycosyltransferase [Gaiellaceae bacterium]|nr:glycosyltransferase [Gaiellaceae bacterium]